MCHITKKKIEQEAIKEAREKIKEELESEYHEKLRTKIIEELQAEIITQTENLLILQEHEENLIRQLSEGKMLKEIDGISKNTKTDYIETAMMRNNCSKNELIALYSIKNRIPDLFPSLFPSK